MPSPTYQLSLTYFLIGLSERVCCECAASHEAWPRCQGVDIREVCDAIFHYVLEATYTYPHSLKRTNGRFADSDLARILQNATAAPAGAFGARATPEVLRVVELLSIESGRKWGVCTVRMFDFITFLSFLITPASAKRVPCFHGIESYVFRSQCFFQELLTIITGSIQVVPGMEPR